MTCNSQEQGHAPGSSSLKNILALKGRNNSSRNGFYPAPSALEYPNRMLTQGVALGYHILGALSYSLFTIRDLRLALVGYCHPSAGAAWDNLGA